MTREEIIQGLQFTIDMFLLDPSTGETYTEPRNDMDKITVDACKGAIELLEQKPCEDTVSRQAVLEQTYDWSKDEFLRVTNPFYYLRKRISSLPPVTPQSKMGKWIDTDNYYQRWKCSECGCHTRDAAPPFCPNCGADMREDG